MMLMKLVENRPGVLSVTHHHARGTTAVAGSPGRFSGARRMW
jgi:hypothetical protein